MSQSRAFKSEPMTGMRELTNRQKWDIAIADATNKMNEARARLKALKNTVATFTRLRDQGTEWPK